MEWTLCPLRSRIRREEGGGGGGSSRYPEPCDWNRQHVYLFFTVIQSELGVGALKGTAFLIFQALFPIILLEAVHSV